MECGGNRRATPLWLWVGRQTFQVRFEVRGEAQTPSESAVDAVALPAQSKEPWRRRFDARKPSGSTDTFPLHASSIQAPPHLDTALAAPLSRS